MGRRILDISEDLCDQLIEILKPSHFALQLNEATEVVKDAHLVAYVKYVVETDDREDLLFRKSIEVNTKAREIFNMIDTFLMKKKFRGRTELGHVQIELPRWQETGSSLKSSSSSNLNTLHDLLTVFEINIKAIHFIKTLRGRLFAKLHNDMSAEYRELLYYWRHFRFLVLKYFEGRLS